MSEAHTMPSRSRKRRPHDESHLRQVANERIKHHLLPAGTRVQVWAGPGSGQPCSLCGEPVEREEIEYEVEESARGALHTYRLHVPCHSLWYSELVASI